jgi:hypothetical protein
MIVIHWYYSKKNISFLKSILTPVTFIFLAGVAITMLVILYFKSLAVPVAGYTNNALNSFYEAGQSILILVKAFQKNIIFGISNPLYTIYTYLVIIILLVTIWMYRKAEIKTDKKKWLIFFISDSAFLLIIILWSHWVYLNDVALRYFTGMYICGWIVIFIIHDHIPGRIKIIMNYLICMTVITGSLSAVYHYKYNSPGMLRPMIQTAKEFEQLGEAGIIGNYWNSYIISCVNPELIKATPHDKEYVRNKNMVDSVFNQPKIYIIKDMWMNHFPDTLYQFDRMLIRKNDSFYIGHSWVNEYNLLPEKDIKMYH